MVLNNVDNTYFITSVKLNSLLIKIVIGFLIALLLFSQHDVFAQTYLDSTASIDERVADLLGKMTLEEKIGQMTQADRGFLINIDDIRIYGLGSLLSGGGSAPENNTAESWADMYDAYQGKALETRLGIPLIYGIDAVHGHNNVKGAVIFPHNIGLGATMNEDLVRQAAAVTAREVAGTGIDWTFAPCIAVPRDERWGRTYEGFGEIPEITIMMSRAAVTGFQGDTLSNPQSIVACAKHFLGDGGTNGGQDQGNTQIDETTLRAIHLPGYIEAIQNDVGTIMATYNSWNGEKVHGSKYLLTTLLKEELGFEGFVVSDWAAIDQLPGDYTSDVKNSINAGIDMVMVPDRYVLFINTLIGLVQQGQVTSERVDDAVERILRIKFKKGLFERPYTNRSFTSEVGSQQHRDVARECVRQSMVLLKKKDNVLPVARENIEILVAGKNANNLGYQCGGWTISWQGQSGELTDGTTILEGIQLLAPNASIGYSATGVGAEFSDIGIVVIGETPYAEGVGDRDDLNLDDEDIAVVRRVKSAGIPVIVVLISGRPMILKKIWHYCDAVFAAWLPGTEGQGIADVLFGDYEPTGKLPHSWPRDITQIPINYGDANYDPLFEYGFGINNYQNSPAGSSPEFLSAAVTSDGIFIEVTFNKKMVDPSESYSSFVIDINQSEMISATQAQLKNNDSTTIILSFDTLPKYGDEILISYTPGNVQSFDGGTLAAFADEFVYNILNEDQAPITVPGKIQAEDYSDMYGVQTEPTADWGGGLNVGWIDQNDWMRYLVNVENDGEYNLAYRYASLSETGRITLSSSISSVIATTNLPVTGGWQTWRTQNLTVNLEKGEQSFTLIADVGGFNLNWFEFESLTSVDENEISIHEFSLAQNYPNPFNGTTSIEYQLSQKSVIEFSIYDILGKRVKTILLGEKQPGKYQITWDGKNNAGKIVAAGIYFYSIKSEHKSISRKLLYLK